MATKNEQLDIDSRYSLNGEQVKFFRENLTEEGLGL